MHRQPDRPSGGGAWRLCFQKPPALCRWGTWLEFGQTVPSAGTLTAPWGGGGFPSIVQELRLGHMAGETWGWNLSSAVLSSSARSFS